MWQRPPHAEIFIDNKKYFDADITGSEEKPDIIEFEHECNEEQNYNLIIKRSGKVKGQTVVNEKGEIDEIDIGALVYEGVYTPDYPEPWASQQIKQGTDLKSSYRNVTSMGFNGTWKFGFSSPFYMWLLENLY